MVCEEKLVFCNILVWVAANRAEGTGCNIEVSGLSGGVSFGGHRLRLYLYEL